MKTIDPIRDRFVIAIRQVIADGKIKNRAKLAKFLGIGASRISEWTKGESSPTKENIADFCNKFKVSTDYILLDRGGVYGAHKGSDIGRLEMRVARLEKKFK